MVRLDIKQLEKKGAVGVGKIVGPALVAAVVALVGVEHNVVLMSFGLESCQNLRDLVVQ